MGIVGAVIVPHPPVILPEVGRGEEKKINATAEAYRVAAKKVAGWKPEALVIASPHTIMYADYFHISPGDEARGDMSGFQAPELKFHARYDKELREEVVGIARNMGLSAGTLGERDSSLDHGVCIPLYFLREAGVECPVLRMGLSGFSALEHYKMGQCIAEASENLNRRAVFVASGDLSHKLKTDGPYGFVPEGPEFDREVTEAMGTGDFLKLLTMDHSLCEKAAECGLRSFQIMAGALDGLSVGHELLSHEDTFGVGYAVAVFPVTGKDPGRKFAPECRKIEEQRLEARKAAEDPWVRLARLSLETYINTGETLKALPAGLPEEMTGRQAGTFVSLHLHGGLRGCIGTIGPVTESVAWEIVRNAVAAGAEDYRFAPVRKQELKLLEYSVDVLGPTEPVASKEELDVKRYGVIVTCGGRRGLLLPNLDGVDSVDQQISIARQKGNIGADEPYTLERFEVVRHL